MSITHDYVEHMWILGLIFELRQYRRGLDLIWKEAQPDIYMNKQKRNFKKLRTFVLLTARLSSGLWNIALMARLRWLKMKLVLKLLNSILQLHTIYKYYRTKPLTNSIYELVSNLMWFTTTSLNHPVNQHSRSALFLYFESWYWTQ